MRTFKSTYDFRPMIVSRVSVAIGTGGKRHDLSIMIEANRDGDLAVWAGQTYCGSQRRSSGWHSAVIDGPVNCEKCLARRPAREYVAASELITVERGRLVVQPDVEIAA